MPSRGGDAFGQMKKFFGVAVLVVGCGLLVMGVIALLSKQASATGTLDIRGPIGLLGALCCLIGGIRLMMPPKPF